MLQQTRAIAFEKLSGTPLSAILKRKAKRLTGRLGREKVRAIVGQAGDWLWRFHEVTRQPPTNHESRLYLCQLAEQLHQCTSTGLDKAAAQGIWSLVAQVSRRLDGQLFAEA